MADSKALRIFIVADFYRGSSSWELAEGLSMIGWDVHIFDLRTFTTDWRSLPLRVLRRLITPLIVKDIHAALLKQCQLIRPNYVLNLKGMFFDNTLIHELRQTGAKLFMFYPDLYFKHKGVDVTTFPRYDGIATAKSFQIRYFREHCPQTRVTYIPHGYSETVHKPVRDHIFEHDYRSDVGYVGNYSFYKEQWLDELATRLPNVSMFIAGGGWMERCQSRRLRPAILGHALFGAPLCEAIQYSRINIAVHWGPVDNGWQDLTSTRTFEIPACKGFMLHVDNEEVRSLYKVGSEIDVFETPQGLATKVAFYLKTPERRRDMIEAAFRRAVPSYGIRARARELAAFLSNP